MKKVFYFLLFALLISFKSNSQPVQLYRDTSIEVFIANKQLPNAWTGGFNAPVFADMDLNGDGRLDLIVFDWLNRNIFRMSCFENNGSITSNPWVFAPQYSKLFPSGLEGWIRTYDYDCDGDLDLFSYYVSGGLELYRNDYTSATGLVFNQVPQVLRTHYGLSPTSLYVTRVDMPALTDLENDNDMDVLAFSISGSFIENNKNLSHDSSLTCGDLSSIYNINGCWGYFYTDPTFNTAVLSPASGTTCPLFPANPFRTSQVTSSLANSRHNGSATLALDIDGDGDKDLVVGDVGGGNLLFIRNGGTQDSAFADLSDATFPAYNVPVNQTTSPFPAPYYFDTDNDGNKDFVAANFVATSENYNNVWLYKNTTNNSTNVFSYVTNRFLANTMIDVGSSAHPVFADIDGDGLKDMIIGNDFYSNPLSGRISFYKNTGTSAQAKFSLITDNLANVDSLGLQGIFPTFGDLDNDGDQDMIIGVDGGTLIYFQNIGTATAPNFIFSSSNYQSINVNSSAAPQLIDVDHDNLLDLIVGNRAGKLSYYRNTGTLNFPALNFVTNNFGNINVSGGSVAGLSAPCLFDHNGSYEMLVGSNSGYIFHYTNIDGNLSGSFTLADSMFQHIYEPAHAVPAVADLDGDNKYDVVVGNSMGGLALYTQNTLLSVNESSRPDNPFFNLYPNPVNDILYLEFDNVNTNSRVEIEVYDIIGNLVFKNEIKTLKSEINISSLASGSYIIRAKNNDSFFTKKFIKQ